MLDESVKKEIIREIDRTKFGKITVELNENSNYVDIKTERVKRVIKKKQVYDKQNVNHFND